jgi:hypothetical protein
MDDANRAARRRGDALGRHLIQPRRGLLGSPLELTEGGYGKLGAGALCFRRVTRGQHGALGAGAAALRELLSGVIRSRGSADDLVGLEEEGRRDGEAERLGRLQ